MLKILVVSLVVIHCCTADELEKLCTTSNIANKCMCGYANYKPPRLHYITDCKRTYLTSLPDIKQIPEHTTELDVSHNNIKNINTGLKSNSIRILLASYNDISAISKEFLNQLPVLTRLDLSHNKIERLDSDVFSGVAGLHHLDLSYNKLIELSHGVFQPLKSLRYLDFGNNVLLGGQLQKFRNLQDSPLGISYNVTTLFMNGVNLTSVGNEFFGNLSAASVSIADNRMVEIPLLPKTLKDLDLSGNLFEVLEARHLNYPSLKTLKVNRLHRLSRVKQYTFFSLISLESLSMENCINMRDFDSLAFGMIVDDEKWNLTEISLLGNAMKHLNETYFKLFNILRKVNLDDNPWDCDCDVLWFQLLGSKLVHRNLRCATPMKYRQRNILELSTEIDMPKCARGAAWRNHKLLAVMLSVLVLTLVALVMYLVYMGPCMKKYRSSAPYVSSTSPYNSLTEPRTP